MRERLRLVNGTLDIESAPGRGTAIVAWVPARRSAAMSSARRPRVLLADDHLMVAEALKSLLAAEFDLVGVVEDGRALVEAAGRLKPDVIVADVTMPRLNGIDALLQLRQEREPGAGGVPHHAPGRELRAARARGRGLGLRAQALGAGRADPGHPRRARRARPT